MSIRQEGYITIVKELVALMMISYTIYLIYLKNNLEKESEQLLLALY